MTLNLGTTNINKLYLGTTEVVKAYLGTTLVYGNNTPTSYVLNSDYIDIIGNVTIDTKGVATNFQIANYLKFKQPFNPEDNDYEIVIKAQIGFSSILTPALFGIKDVYSFVIGANRMTSGYNIWTSSNGTSWDLDNSSSLDGEYDSYQLLYWKLSYNSNTNTTSIATSLDGVSYKNIKDYNTKLYFNDNCYLYISGNRSNTNNEIGANSQVYLAESYYKIGTNSPIYFAIPA